MGLSPIFWKVRLVLEGLPAWEEEAGPLCHNRVTSPSKTSCFCKRLEFGGRAVIQAPSADHGRESREVGVQDFTP